MQNTAAVSQLSLFKAQEPPAVERCLPFGFMRIITAHKYVSPRSRPLTPEECRQAGVSSGLVVDDAEGAAADAGIQPGDVVLSVDGTPVSSVAQMRKIVSNHDKQIALLIQRGDNRIFVPVTLG